MVDPSVSRFLLLRRRPHADLRQSTQAIRNLGLCDPVVLIYDSRSGFDTSLKAWTRTTTSLALPIRRMERLDAVHHPHLPLHRRLKDHTYLPGRTASGRVLPLHDRIRTYSLLLGKTGLLIQTRGGGLDQAEFAELHTTLHDADGLSILLLCAADKLLVPGRICHAQDWLLAE